jgi:hypothetical protein
MKVLQKCPKLSEPVRLRTTSDKIGRKTEANTLKMSLVRSVRSVRSQKQCFAPEIENILFFDTVLKK